MHRPTPSRRVANSLAGNAVALAAGRVIAVMGALLIAVVVSRRLGSDAFGRFGAIAAAGFVANTVLTFGTDTVIVRAVADERADARDLVATSSAGQLLGAVALVGVAGVAVALDVVGTAVVVQAVGLIPMAVVTVAGAVLRGSERMRPLAVAAAVSATGSLLVALLVVDSPDHVDRAIGSLVVGQCLAAGLLAHHARAWHPSDRAPSAEGGWARRVASLASQTWVFAAMVVASAVSLQGVLTVVAVLGERRRGGALDLGGLVASVRVLEAARIAPAAAFGAALPAAFARRWPAASMRRWSTALLGYAGAVTIGLIVVGERLVEFAFGPVAHGGVVGLLALALVPIVLRLELSTELLGAGRERLVLAAAALGAVATLVVAIVAALGSWSDADTVRIVALGQVAGVVVSVGVLAVLGRRASATTGPGVEDGSIR